jgi:DeoR/GlpR family transcriptional regulator of sugar metabolism
MQRVNGKGNDMVQETFRYTSAPRRREQLTQFIAEQGYCTISELSEAFAVSEMTIRRDVTRLVEQGLVRGFRGGVGSLTRAELVGSDYRYRDVSHASEKHAIAARAVGLVDEGAVIAVDAGTTAHQLAALLPLDLDVTVITNSFAVIESLVSHPGARVICLGGTLHQESLSFDGPGTLGDIANLQVQRLFLGASGISERGAFCANGFDAITKRALIEVSEDVVLLADSSKFGNSAMVKICDWDAIDRVIIDSGIPKEQQAMLTGHDVEVITVATEERDLAAAEAS